jgi:hypothetical protein
MTLDMFWWRRIRHDVNDYCHRCVACRRAKERAQLAYSHGPLRVQPQPWHNVGLYSPIYFLVCASLDNVLVVVDHLTRMVHF